MVRGSRLGCVACVYGMICARCVQVKECVRILREEAAE